ncbi:MAG: Hsp70 family protein [Defluviitaleaceae bacterium]|nr:Hsp70 family protein [Defluviitaleaceae bacterium]
MEKIKTYGIDLGTTYSAIAHLDDTGRPEIIDNPDDPSTLLASAVYFQEGGVPVVGMQAKEEAEMYPDRVVQFIKREIGKEDAFPREYDDQTYNAVEISSLILKRIVEYANAQGHDVKNVIITCPAYFGNDEREATKQAGQLAGLNVLELINEPTAAAYNFLSKEFKENKKILVYDLGGGTFDVSYIDYIVDGEKTVVDVRCSDGNDRLGGKDWDDRLFSYLKELYIGDPANDCDSNKFDEDFDLRQLVRNKVEDTKKALSARDKTSVRIENTRLEVQKDKFEERTKDLLQQTIDVVNFVLKTADADKDAVDLVLLVGGSTKMPMVKNAVKAMFGDEKVREEDPDKAVAKGAALAAAAKVDGLLQEVFSMFSKGGGDSDEESDQIEANKGFEILADLVGESAAEEIANLSGDDLATAVAEITPAVPTAFEGGMKVLDRLPRSFGPRVAQFGNNLVSYVDNLIFMDQVVPVEMTKTYSVQSDNAPMIRTALYENRAVEGSPPIHLTEADGSDAHLDPALQVKNLGEVTMPLPPGTPKGTAIEVTIHAKLSGIELFLKNPATGEVEKLERDSEYILSREEFEQSKQKIAAIETTGEVG